ncbi:hypothetical protein WJX82_003636 [Trebouxia sp. C0006]
MLHCFKDSYAASKNHSAANLVQCDSSAVWSLAVLGVLDMEFFKMALQPSDKSTPAYAEWSQVAHHVQLEWPMPKPSSTRSQNEMYIFNVIQLMGYVAIAHHVSEDGMHSIDIALLPQAKVPCKVAIEVDGFPHFLYETCKLDKGPIATRPDGSILFRNAALEEQGWRVVTVPWFEWEYQRTKTDKVAYLETEIREAVSQHALNDRLQHQMC